MSINIKKYNSTGEARVALGLDDKKPNFNIAANMYWSACNEIIELREKLDNPTCHRGHSDLPLTLWDCPTCVQNEKNKLEAENERLRERLETALQGGDD